MLADFGRTVDDYAKHRAGFPEAFFQRLEREGVLRPGLRVVDLGTGTGTIARGLARRGCTVTGLDISESMLEGARRLASEQGLSIEFRRAPAERTELPSSAFELVTAGQCWHWFDRAAAAREAMRLLVPGGRIVIAHFDWVMSPGNVVEATEALMEEFNPGPPLPQYIHGHNVGLYPAWFRDLKTAGYVHLESFSFDVDVPYTHESWRGRVRASAKVGGSLPKEKVARFDEAFAALLSQRFPQDPLSIPHRVFALFATRP
jgi:SAM-dependent methyltransferase